MIELRYKAFISYSHQDERWARWLQRALERYRVPRRLVGQVAEHGPIPARLRPVFRDREDLSSSSDLSSRIKQELEASESLVVLCSPAAANSRWVSEEVRYFRELGRGDRVLALIVDGDPAAADCFPQPMLDGDGDGRREPLAADMRRYADGKHLALLKIVAGILGVRLDELRRRDAQRRLRRRAVNTAVAVSVALVIAWLFHSAQSSGERLRMSQSNTEEYLDFMLGNLRRLEPLQDLEAVSPHGEMRDGQAGELGLADLDGDALLAHGKEWRDDGLDDMQEGELDRAMVGLEKSRLALAELLQRDRSSTTALYELGQTEFYIGATHVRRGEIDEAQWHWYRYGVLTRRLVNADPYNPEYVMELAYTLNNIGAVEQQKLMPDYQASLDRINQAISFNRQAINLDPQNLEFQRALTTMLEWAADAHWGLCQLGEALEFRQQTVERRRDLVRRNPESVQDRTDLGFTLSGLGGVQEDIGLVDAALESHRQAVDVLRPLSEADPMDALLAWEVIYREVRWARVLAWSGDPDRAEEFMLAQAPRADELAAGAEASDTFVEIESALFQLDLARILRARGDTAAAEDRLRNAVSRLAEIVARRPAYRNALKALIRAYFEYWAHFGSGPGPRFDPLVDRFPVTPESVQSCHDADTAARLAMIRGDGALAARYVDYALGTGYFHPDFIAFCNRYGLCDLPGEPGMP